MQRLYPSPEPTRREGNATWMRIRGELHLPRHPATAEPTSPLRSQGGTQHMALVDIESIPHAMGMHAGTWGSISGLGVSARCMASLACDSPFLGQSSRSPCDSGDARGCLFLRCSMRRACIPLSVVSRYVLLAPCTHDHDTTNHPLQPRAHTCRARLYLTTHSLPDRYRTTERATACRGAPASIVDLVPSVGGPDSRGC